MAMADGHPIDGTLANWGDITGWHWSGLLIGNGLSINIWHEFQFPSLYAEAKSAGALAPEDDRLFSAFGTQNFEVVLGRLKSAIRAAETLGQDSKPYYARYES